MRTRMYRTDWGRFAQPDTIGYAGGNNLYAYVGNDPLNRTDPLGLCDNPQGCGGGLSNQLIPLSVTPAVAGLTQTTPTTINSTGPTTPMQLADVNPNADTTLPSGAASIPAAGQITTQPGLIQQAGMTFKQFCFWIGC